MLNCADFFCVPLMKPVILHSLSYLDYIPQDIPRDLPFPGRFSFGKTILVDERMGISDKGYPVGGAYVGT
jgi:hypothetical protein